MGDAMQLWMLAGYFAAVCILAGLMIGLAYVLGQRHSQTATRHPFESGMLTVGDAFVRYPARYYLVAIFFVIFDLEAVFVLAWAVCAREAGWAGFIEISVFIGILLAALVYLWRTGALDWAPPRSRARAYGEH